MRCGHCGHENPDHVIYCGMCGKKALGADQPSSGEVSAAEGGPSENSDHLGQIWSQPDMPDYVQQSLISVAVNVRRIFLILALGLVMTLSSMLFMMALDYWWESMDLDTIILVNKIWYSALAVIIVLGLVYIVRYKKITSL